MMTGRQSWQKRTLFDARFVRFESRRTYRLAFILFWSVLLFFFFHSHIIGLGVVADRSMMPVLSDGSYFLINKYVYSLKRPERGDVVVFRSGNYASEEYVKRIIGMEGDVLQIRGGHVFINGFRLIEPYVYGPTFPDMGPLRIGADRYFVMGDNRIVSEDSRFFGTISLRDIIGKIKPGELFAFN